MKIFTFCSVILFFTSCNTASHTVCWDDYFEIDSLKYSEVLCKDFLWGAPMGMLSIDSTIFVYDERCNSNLFHAFSCKYDSVFSFGVKGEGENEFIMPFDIQAIDSVTVGVFDMMRRGFYSIEIDSIVQGKYNVSCNFKDSIIGTIKLLPTNYKSYVTLGLYNDCMFKLHNFQTKEVKSYGEFPYRDDNERNVEGRLRGMAYQGSIRLNPDKDRFAFAINSADIIYFYQITSDDLILLKKYELNYPEYMANRKGDTRSTPISNTNKRTFLDVATSNEYVYALYSGKSFQEKGLKFTEGNIIYVFDWNGRPIKQYVLDKSVTNLCVSKDNAFLYGFSNMPEPTLISFKLISQ